MKKLVPCDYMDNGMVALHLAIDPSTGEDAKPGEGETPETTTYEPPNAIRILANGLTQTTKGPILYNAEAGKAVMERLSELGRDKLPFDYGHGMIGMIQSYETARAAGWFQVEAREDGLWAANIQWTPTAEKALKDREFRYFSPFLYLNRETAEIMELVNIALTCIPATINQTPIAASQAHGKDTDMDPKQLFDTMGVQNASQAAMKFSQIQQDNAKLIEGAQAAQVKLSALEAENKSLKETQVKAEREALVASLTAEGKLSPSLKEWAMALSVDALKAFGEKAPVVASSEGVVPKTPTKTESGATEEDIKIAKLYGISIDEFMQNKAGALTGRQEFSWADQARNKNQETK